MFSSFLQSAVLRKRLQSGCMWEISLIWGVTLGDHNWSFPTLYIYSTCKFYRNKQKYRYKSTR